MRMDLMAEERRNPYLCLDCIQLEDNILQLNPANPGVNFHKLDKAKDKNFWSVGVSRDIRLLLHKTEASLLLCYVDQHDGHDPNQSLKPTLKSEINLEA